MADLSEHFFAGKDCKIHTYRSGDCPQGSCNHRTAVPKPFPWIPDEAHHILCVSATIAYKGLRPYKSEPLLGSINGAYFNTAWCVNKAPNMIWLPLKNTYSVNGAAGTNSPVWGLDLPCHNQDHNCAEGYTDEVIDKMKGDVWDRIKAKQELEPPECMTEAEMQVAFSGVQSHFRSELIRRGLRNGGTRAARQGEAATPQMSHWWLPFSMAKDVIAMNRLVRSFGAKPRWAAGFLRTRP
jgi:hypothetical protein